MLKLIAETFAEDKYYKKGQRLRLDDNCYEMGTILHELMHAIGFPHKQARFDRDEFVEIMYNNIETRNRTLTEKLIPATELPK